jgi:tetratricopeptide (TPR) repeat protein
LGFWIPRGFFISLSLFLFNPSVFAQEDLLNLPKEYLPLLQRVFLDIKAHPEKILPYLVVMVVLSFLLKALFSFLGKWRGMASDQNRYGGKKQIKQMTREARHYEKEKDYLAAGEIYELINDLDKAKQMYKKGKGNQQVGRIFEKLQQWDQAAAFYELAQSYESAARNYQKGKNFQKAAELYLKGGKGFLAGEMYEAGEMYLEAGKIFEKANYFQKAGWMYFSAREIPKAAEMFERYFLQEFPKLKDSNASLSPGQRDALNGYSKKSGELYLTVGKVKEAANIFLIGGFVQEAAQAFRDSGEHQRAADLYVGIKEYDKAAEVLREGGDVRQGDLLIGEKYAREERFTEAAYYYEQAQEFNQAGEMYERAGDLKRAGEMFFKGGDLSKSSEIFLALGDKPMAAQALEKGRRFQEAARLYQELKECDKAIPLLEKESLFLEAANLREQQGKVDESILLLQKVDSKSEDYSEASLALARLFTDKGMFGPAREKYQRALARRPVNAETIEHYYQLANLHERLEDFEGAMILFERILAENIQYKDVKAKLENLQNGHLEKPMNKKKALGKAQVVENRYKLLREIGRGGMGVVYKAEDIVLKRIVAYKILPESVRGNQKVLGSFIQEARTAASIHHPNIVTIFDSGQSEGDYFITMEFVDGMTLKELLEKNQLLPISDIVQIFQQICTGMDYAHSRRVIHRDIKPGNIMISRDKVVKIMDFGLAKIVHDSMGETTEVKGTPLYMSPEQILGKEVDHQSDIYSLGCTMFRMVTGKPPFFGNDVFNQHLHKNPPDPATLNSKSPTFLNQIILKCLEKEKLKRYSRVKDILKDLSVEETK